MGCGNMNTVIMNNVNTSSCVFVIFGGTGDLAHRKLIPALYNLKYQDLLPSGFAIAAVGRKDKTDEEYRNEAYNSVKKYARFEISEDLWNDFCRRIFYKKLDFTRAEGYFGLNEFLSGIDSELQTEGNRVYYLATAPGNFEIIADNLHAANMAGNALKPWQRVVIEKPFGSSLASARQLNRKISDVFGEENVYRIDHYLGKEMVQSIMGLRFFNTLFEPLWSNKYIDNIQISSCETIGIENRGEYYEKTGALGDMVQNHMLQILALLAMEPPTSFNAEAIRDEKVKVLASIKEFTSGSVARNVVLGQYAEGEAGGRKIAGYRQERRVSPDSQTETFAALKIELDNPRWKGVPFYIRTGKRLAAKKTDIVIELKPSGAQVPNLIVIKIQPKEELFIRFNTKKPGIHGKICPVKMTYCQKCEICEAENNSPEAYEKLIIDVINGDQFLFTRWDGVEKSWSFIEKIKALKEEGKCSLSFYRPGTWGPEAAEHLPERDGRHWWNL